MILLLACGIILSNEYSSAQVIRAKERRAAAKAELTQNRDNETLSRRNAALYEIDDESYEYFVSDQFVYDNLHTLKNVYVIPDIYFDLDQSVIRHDAFNTLDQLSLLLLTERDLSVAITARSDTRIAEYNNILSIRRANAARAYLIGRGISPQRIIVDIHGRPSVKNPCTDNPGCSIEEQQINRRTEFNIIYNNINLAHVHAYEE